MRCRRSSGLRLVAQGEHVGRYRLHLVIRDLRTTLGWHRDLALGFFGGHARGDLLDDRVVGAIAVKPLRVREIRAHRALRVGPMAGVAVALAVEDAVALSN